MKQLKIVQERSDDLDLLVLLEKAIAFFTRYGKFIGIVALSMMLLASLLHWRLPNSYSSTLLLQPAMLTSPEQIELVNSWRSMLKKKETVVLAKQWKLSPAVIKKLKSIEAEEIHKTSSPTNFTAFTLTIRVTDTRILPALQQGILYGLDNGEYIKDKIASRKQMINTLVKTIDAEISRLKTMQAALDNNSATAPGGGSRIIVDVTGLSSQVAALEEKKLNLQESLAFTASAHALQNFYVPAKAEPRLLKYLFISCALGLMTGGALSLFVHIRRKIKIRGHAR